MGEVVDPVPPLEGVSPSEGEAVADVEAEAFEGGPIDFSLLPLYPDQLSNISGTER